MSSVLTMHFDGARSITRVGAGIVFTYSLGKVVSFSYRLEFDCADNVAMHDALIELSRDIRIKALKVIGDSDLIVQQAKNLCADKNARLKKYGNIVWDTIKLFQSFSIYAVPREMSTHANGMAESSANFQPYRDAFADQHRAEADVMVVSAATFQPCTDAFADQHQMEVVFRPLVPDHDKY